MPRQYEDDDEDDQKPGPPPGFTEQQDRWGPGRISATPTGRVPGAAAPPPVKQKAADTTEGEPERERMGRTTGVFGQREHPEIEMLESAYGHLKSGEYQKAAHEAISGAMEILKPTAGLIGAAGPLAAAKTIGYGYMGQRLGEKAGPLIGLTPELGGDIGGIIGAGKGGGRELSRAQVEGGPRGPRYGGQTEVMGAQEPAPETLRRTTPPEAPGGLPGPGAPVPPEQTLPRTRTADLDRIAIERYGRPYDTLAPEEKMTVARMVGEGGPGGVERRVTPGEGPVMERRAGAMPAISRAGEAGAGATPPSTLPIARPGQPNAEPTPPGTLPRTTLPPAPPPTTLGGPRRGEPTVEGKPPPVDPLKEEFPNPKVRQLARVNGAEIVRASYDQPEVLEAVHSLTNVEIRQAAINAGIDLGTKHVGSRMNLGPEQVSRQDLIDQMIRQGVKPEDIPRLAGIEQIPYTKPMAIPEKNKNTRFGVTDLFVHYHELAHAIIGGLHGFNPMEIASHKYPAGGRNVSASVLFDMSQFRTGGVLSAQKLAGGVGEKFLEVLAGGQAAGEVLNGMAKDANFTASGDKNMAANFLQAMGIPKTRWNEYWDAAYDRAKAKLTPEVVEIMKDEATRREENLPAIYHYSKDRVAHIVERVKDATEQTIRTGEPGYAGATSQEAYRTGQATLPFAEGRAQEGPVRPTGAQTLKRFSNPQNTYKFEVWDNTQPGPHEIELQAVDRKTAWKNLDEEVRKRAGPTGAPGYHQAKMLSEVKPEVGPPLIARPKEGFQTLPHVPEDLVQHFTSDEIASARARPLLQKNFVKAYNALEPTLREIKNAMSAGHGLGGWWDRYVDALETMGAHNEAADMQQLTQTHAEALKAFHGALSGNKAIEQANIISWGAYRDWLRAGQPRDVASINRIIKANHGLSGLTGLDTRKIHSLVNSPQFREGAPFTSDAWLKSPVAGTSPGTLKIPSMVGTSAGPGGRGPENLMRTVIDRHILDLYGKKGLTDAQYLAISVHLRQAAEMLGLAGRDGQGQGWGTVLGLKVLREQGMTPKQAAQAYSKDVLAGVGKDYAQTILESAQKNKRVAQALEDLKEFGMDTGNPATMQRLMQIVEEGQRRMAERARPVNRQLLESSAQRIWRMMKQRPKKGGGD